jgi:hypothetical protein
MCLAIVKNSKIQDRKIDLVTYRTVDTFYVHMSSRPLVTITYGRRGMICFFNLKKYCQDVGTQLSMYFLICYYEIQILNIQYTQKYLYIHVTFMNSVSPFAKYSIATFASVQIHTLT